MSVMLPSDPKKRIKVMLTVMRGYVAKYTVDGKTYLLRPERGAYSEEPVDCDFYRKDTP
jgi:hypothetical protein